MSEGPIKEPTEERKRNQKAANQDLDRRKLTSFQLYFEAKSDLILVISLMKSVEILLI